MPDPRATKLGKLLINYSLGIKPRQKLRITAPPLASELTLAVYEEAIKAGAYVLVFQPLLEAQEIFYKLATDDQLDFVSPVAKLFVETFDASIYIDAAQNQRSLSGIDPD